MAHMHAKAARVAGKYRLFSAWTMAPGGPGPRSAPARSAARGTTPGGSLSSSSSAPAAARVPRALQGLRECKKRLKGGRLGYGQAKQLAEAVFTPAPNTYDIVAEGPSGGRLACRSDATWLGEYIKDGAWVPGPGAHLEQRSAGGAAGSADFGKGSAARDLFRVDAAQPGPGVYDIERAERAMGVGEARLARMIRHTSRFHEDEVAEMRVAVLPSPFSYAPPSVVSSRDLPASRRPGVRIRGKEGVGDYLEEAIKSQKWTPGVGRYGGIAFEGSTQGASLDRFPRTRPGDHDTIGAGPGSLHVTEAYRKTLTAPNSIKLQAKKGVLAGRSAALQARKKALGRSPGPAYDTSGAYAKTSKSVPGFVLRPQHLVATKLDEARTVRAAAATPVAPEGDAAGAYFAQAPAAAPTEQPSFREASPARFSYLQSGNAKAADTFAYLAVGRKAKDDYERRNRRQKKPPPEEAAAPTPFVAPALPNAPSAQMHRVAPTAGKITAKEYRARYLRAFRACRDAEAAYGGEAMRADESGKVYEDEGLGFATRVPAAPTRSAEAERADRLVEKLVTPSLDAQDPRLKPDEERFWSAHVYDVYKKPRSDTMYDDRKPATPAQRPRNDDDDDDDGSVGARADGAIEFDGELTDPKWTKLLSYSRRVGPLGEAADRVAPQFRRKRAAELFSGPTLKAIHGGRER